MNSKNIVSEKLEQYNYHRTRLIDLCHEAEVELANAQEIQKLRSAYLVPTERLREDSYTLVLIGGFQSGKSTLFNYLCDGRELSPIGPSGGGLRTSGCMVTAHPVQEGETERAIVSWRTPEDLLAALGSSLIRYYDSPTSLSCLTPQEVNLEQAADRARLAELAMKKLTDSEEEVSTETRELLRFTLLICRFYEQFAERCKSGTSTCLPDETVKLTSYPQDWEIKWAETEEKGTWFELPEFSADEVNFAFCGGVELFLDSHILRDLGCSVIDCPGLFISKWDTEIASRCIREANAILYMIEGEKQLSLEAIHALQECVRLGGAHKIIFGANLRKKPIQWERVLKNGVLPALKRNGFSNPVVHNFHAAMALRSRELMYCEGGMLPAASEAAVEYNMALEGENMSIVEYLRSQLDIFLPIMGGAPDMVGDYVGVEKLSGVPDFVGAASNHVVENRVTSVLVHEGTKRIEASLAQAKAEMEHKKQLLETAVTEAGALLEAAKNKACDFRKDRDARVDKLSATLTLAEQAILTHYRGIVEKKIAEKRGKLIEITKSHIPTMLELPFVDRNRISQEYAEELGAVLSSILKEVQGEISKYIMHLPAVSTFKDVFEMHRKELMDQLKSFKNINCVADYTPQFPADFDKSTNSMVLPTARELLDRAFDSQRNPWQWLWIILTVGIFTPFPSREAHAAHIVDKSMEQFVAVTFNNLKHIMEQETPAGPMKVLQNTFAEFKKCFSDAEAQIMLNIDNAEELLQERSDRASLVPALRAASEKMKELLEKCSIMEEDIRKDFPPMSA